MRACITATRGSEISIEDITSREGITVEEVLDSYTEEEIFENAMNMMDIDRSEELAGLKAFLDGSDNPLSSYDNPLGGNRIIARGSIGRWDGTRHGLAVYRDFDDMMSGPDPFSRIVKSARSGMRTAACSSTVTITTRGRCRGAPAHRCR